MELTYESGAEEFIVESFGWHVDEDGYVRDSDGSYAPSTTGEPVQVDDVSKVIDDDGDSLLKPAER